MANPGIDDAVNSEVNRAKRAAQKAKDKNSGVGGFFGRVGAAITNEAGPREAEMAAKAKLKKTKQQAEDIKNTKRVGGM